MSSLEQLLQNFVTYRGQLSVNNIEYNTSGKPHKVTLKLTAMNNHYAVIIQGITDTPNFIMMLRKPNGGYARAYISSYPADIESWATNELRRTSFVDSTAPCMR